MLVPESGASTIMKKATRQPIAKPVKRVRRGDVVKARIVAMRVNEIAVSATNATASPVGPGTVTA